MHTKKPRAGAAFPPMTGETVAAARIDLSPATGWRALVVYRGKHCPLCKTYLDTLRRRGRLDRPL